MFGSFLLFLKIFWGISWWSPGWILMGLIARDVCLSLSLFLVSCFIAAVHFSSFHSLCTPPPCLSVILTFTLCLSVPVSPFPPLYFCFHHASVFHAEVSVDGSHIFRQPFTLLLLSFPLPHIVPSPVSSPGPHQTSQNSGFQKDTAHSLLF